MEHHRVESSVNQGDPQCTDSSSRYRSRRPSRDVGPSYGWSKNIHRDPDVPTAPDVFQQEVVDLMDALSREPIYDGDKQAEWDRLLEMLNMKLIFQPAVAQVLSQENWRSANNPRAYVATASYNLGLSVRLPDFRKGYAPAPERPALSVADEDDEIDVYDLDSTDGRVGPWYAGPFDDDESWDRRFPVWLRHPVEGDRVNWALVARHATRKPSMIPSLALALELRFDRHLSLEEAIRQARRQNRRLNIEAAWKWIDRNAMIRISPLFKLDREPKSNPPRRQTEPRRPLKPWEVLERVIGRNKPKLPDMITSPSIMQDGNTPLSRYKILQPGTQIWRRNELGIIDNTPCRTYRFECEIESDCDDD